jgi:plasmid stabilization system protein ParE
MLIKWNKSAIQQFLDAIRFIEENEFYTYALQLEKDIFSIIRSLPQHPSKYPLDKYRRKNDGTYRAFEIDHYRVSYRNKGTEIRIVRVRHTSRRIRKY